LESKVQTEKIKILLFLVFLPVFLQAGENGGKAGFEFLRWEIGARPTAMGGAFVSMIGDLYGLRYNPATLVGTKDMETTFTYLNSFLDFKSGFAGLSKSVSGMGQVGIGIFYTNYGEFRRTDVGDTDMGSFTPADYVVSVTYADSLTMGLRFGASFKYIQSRIDQYTSSAVAADIGIIYRLPKENVSVGFSILNAGSALRAFVEVHEKLPTSYRLGVSERLAHLPLLLNFNLIKYQYEESSFLGGLYWALGGEFTIMERFFLRWGYNSRGREEKGGVDTYPLAGVSLGLGISYRKYRFDYGWSSYGALGNANTFTITIPF